MKGLFKTAAGKGHMEIRETDVPRPGPGEVLIEIRAAGICGSDLHIYNWDINFAMRPPMIIGHEFSGVIAEIGPDVEGLSVGDRVTAEPSAIICGRCHYCRTGAYNLCPERRVLGYWVNGAFAEYTVVQAIRIHRLPQNIGFQEGALTEPLACCVHGILELTGIRAGDRVAITGPGTIGLLSLQLARAEGGEVVVIGTAQDDKRLEVARKMGAAVVIDADSRDPLAAVRDMTDGYGADVVLECSGAGPAAAMGLDLVRKQGKYTQLGLFGKPITIDFEKIAYKEIKVTGSLAQRWTAWKWTLKLMEQRKVDLQPIISDVVPLTEWEAAFDTFRRKQAFKILFDPKR
jgi:L-iditol 2-dehydrogenase